MTSPCTRPPLLALILISLSFSPMVLGCAGKTNIGENHDAGVDAPMRMGPYDECGNGMDDDGDGLIDEGCFCGGGETQSCFTGTYPNRGVGACADGVQACDATSTMEFGHWGACTMDTLPADEACDGVDNNCNGAIDEGCPCTAGQTQGCGSEFAIAPCSSGTQTCGTDGTWSACEGAIGPSAEVCGPGGRGDGIDNDCDGTTDEGCDCVPEPEVCGDGLDNDCDGTIDEDACATPAPDAGVPDAGSLDAGADATVDVDGGMTSCTGAGEWTLRLPVVPLGGSVDSSPGGYAKGQHLAVDGEGVLLAGPVISAQLALGSFTAVSGPFRTTGALSNSTFIAAFSPTGTIRYAYAPVTRDFDPLTPYGDVPGVAASGMVSDGSGGAWLSGQFNGIVEMAPAVVLETPPPTTITSDERDALVFHVSRTGEMTEARAFGRAGQADRFGAIARREDQLFVAGLTGDFFDMDGTPVLPPSANAKYVLSLRPSSGSYAPERIDYVDEVAGGMKTIIPATNGTDVRYGVGGFGALQLGGSTVGIPPSRGIAAILTPTLSGYDTVSFVASDGSYTFPSSITLSATGDTIMSGSLRGTTSFGGAPISSGGAAGDDGFGAFIAVLRADGTHRWSRALVPSPVDPFHSLSAGASAVDADGNVYFATSFGNRAGSTIDLGGGPITLPANALVFVSYDSAGALRWSIVEPAGDVQGLNDIAVDACGALYVTGRYHQASWATGVYLRRISAR